MSDNDNEDPTPEPAVILDHRRGLRGQDETDRRRQRSAVRADQDAVRDSQASLEKHLFAGPALNWVQAAEKASHLLRRYAATGEAQDPRYKQMIEDALEDLQRLTDNAKEPPL